MRILVTGANGFLGHSLVPGLVQAGHEVLATGRGACRLNAGLYTYAALDITDHPAVNALVNQFAPALIIHAAAMTKPDECALHPAKAREINVDATRNLLAAAGKMQSRFLYMSTDFVFDGLKGMYTETDMPSPVNEYGQTKWEAEKLVQQYPLPWSIVRTVLVYGKAIAGRANIISILKEKLLQQQPYRVVDDQVRTPTWVEDLARGIVLIVNRQATGIWHLAGKDIRTPYELAMDTAAILKADKSVIIRVTADTFKEPARRPARTGLCIDKARHELGYEPVSVEEGLRRSLLDE